MSTEVRALVDEGAARLQRVAAEPRLESRILLAAALGRTQAWLLAHADEQITDCEATDRFEAAITRRALGEPVAYILGEKEFWSLRLRVGPQVLIPRPETEIVVERALARLATDSAAAVLDLATGSGAIALAIASERPRAQVTATDVSTETLAIALGNAASLGLERVEFLAGEWYAPVAGRRFALIASNPPYIAASDPRVESAVRRYEPHLALYSGETGIEALRTIVAGAADHLESDGWIVLEHGDTQGAAVRELLAAAGFTGISTCRDLAGLDRCTEGRRPG